MRPLIQTIWLSVSAVLFVLWVWCMFRALFALTRAARMAAEARGGIWPTPREAWDEFRRFVADPAHKGTRWQLAGLTAGLIAVYPLGLAIWGTGPP